MSKLKTFEEEKKSFFEGINLQLFAEGDNDPPDEPEGDSGGDDPDKNPSDDKSDDGKKYSQEQVEKMISDEKAKEKAKWEKEYKEKLEKEKAEAEKLAKMSSDDRAKAEFEKKQREFEEQRKEFERDKLSLEVKKLLNESELNQDFAEFLIADDAETSFKNVKTFKEVYEKEVEAGVKKALSGNTPKEGSSNKDTSSIGARIAKSANKKSVVENPYFKKR